MEAMHELIKRDKLKGGKVDSVKAFAASIGQSPQNFSKYSTHGQHVSIVVVIDACKRYRINPTWLVLGEGEMFLGEQPEPALEDIKRRLIRIEKLLK